MATTSSVMQSQDLKKKFESIARLGDRSCPRFLRQTSKQISFNSSLNSSINSDIDPEERCAFCQKTRKEHDPPQPAAVDHNNNNNSSSSSHSSNNTPERRKTVLSPWLEKHRDQQNEKKIGKYVLGPVLGFGDFGKVYSGLDTTEGSLVAIKRVEVIDKMSLQRLQEQFPSLQALHHPNLVKYITMIPHKHKVSLVLEFMDSGSLADSLLKFGLFPESLVARYMVQALKGLTFLHDNHIIHKGLKASNMLLLKNGTLKLTDYAKTLQNARSVILPFWNAPEVITGAVDSKKLDLWAIGATIVGLPPWGDLEPATAARNIMNQEILEMASLTEISQELRDFLKTLFEKKALKRPTAKEALSAKWFELCFSDKLTFPQKELKSQLRQYNRGSLNVGLAADESINSESPSQTIKQIEKIDQIESMIPSDLPELEKAHLTFDDLDHIEKISISATKTVKAGYFKWTVYTIEMQINGKTFKIDRRYSEFLQLYTAMYNKFNMDKVQFPPKRWFGYLDPEVVDDRKKQLEKFLQIVAKNEKARKHPSFLTLVNSQK